MLAMMSCTEGRDAGDLWGMWQSADTPGQYISFSGNVVSFRSHDRGEVFGKFQHVGDSLFIMCVSPYQRLEDTLAIEEYYHFRPFHNIRLRILTLDGKRLIMQQGAQQWRFNSY